MKMIEHKLLFDFSMLICFSAATMGITLFFEEATTISANITILCPNRSFNIGHVFNFSTKRSSDIAQPAMEVLSMVSLPREWIQEIKRM
jgi:hypothetical protein